MVTLDKSRFIKTVTSPFTGQEYEIRRLSVREYFLRIGVMPVALPEALANDLAALSSSVSAQLKEKSTDKDFESKVRLYTIENGVISPKVWAGDSAECPEGQVSVEDLGDDLAWLAAQVIEFTFELAFLRGMDKFFRGANTGDSGLDGEAVRDKAVESDA